MIHRRCVCVCVSDLQRQDSDQPQCGRVNRLALRDCVLAPTDQSDRPPARPPAC